MKKNSFRSKLAKEFREAQIKAGIAEPVVGVGGALLLRKLCAAAMPLMTVHDGRERRQPPIGMGVLVVAKLARYEPTLQVYEVTTKGVSLDALLVANGLIDLALSVDEKITSFVEGGESA